MRVRKCFSSTLLNNLQQSLEKEVIVVLPTTREKNIKTQSRLIRLIGVVFSNGTMLSMLDKYDSVDEHTQDISELTKLHIQGVWQKGP